MGASKIYFISKNIWIFDEKKRVWGSNLITNYSKSQQFCVLLHILLEKGHFEKLNCEIKFMGTFNTAKKSEF